MEHLNIEKIANTIGVQMLPAFEGDCILVQLPDNAKIFRMLIDCGPAKTWNTVLKDLFDYFYINNMVVDILVITHIDYDHIGGAIPLFKNNKFASIVKTIWYNGLKQIDNQESVQIIEEKDLRVYRELSANRIINFEDSKEQISINQCKVLSQLLSDNNVPINLQFDGKSITYTDKEIQISEDISIKILTPSQMTLNKLLNKFQKELNSIKMGSKIVVCPESEKSFDLSLLCIDENIISNENISFSVFNANSIEEYANARPVDDTSVTNLSSISFILKYKTEKYLFSGDINNNELIAKLCNIDLIPLFFDIIKVPHHGSKNNSMKIFDFLDGEIFLISTNGSKYNHPDKECISKIISRPCIKKRTLIFNYMHDIYDNFNKCDIKSKYDYECEFLYKNQE